MSAGKAGEISVYSDGIVHCSVCVPQKMERAEVERRVNIEHPAGTRNGWRISRRETFASGQPNPCSCEENTETRLHYLMEC
jgi:hypothetical protein